MSAISHEEFHRLQTQLLDLRTANYTLMEESNRYKNEMRNAVLKWENVDKEFQKAQRALEKSRKARDVEMLFAENDALQNKLLSQEEQFREQNQALLQELANLVAANEKLEADLKKRRQLEPERSEGSCQCDLSTEHYEALLSEERHTISTLYEDLCLKNNQISELTSTLSETSSKHSTEMHCLNEKISSLQIEANKLQPLIENLEKSERDRNELVTDIQKLNKHLSHCREQFNKEITELLENHQLELENQKTIHREEAKQYEIQLELASAQRTEFEEEAWKARQEAQDAHEDVRIAERRIVTVTADLRRQLRGERRRADKLQERLGDFDASNPLPNTSVDHDNCSVSSWSLMSGQNGEAVPATPSPPLPATDSPSSGRSDPEQAPDLMSENGRLVSRLATMQQEKWRLEERVLHLEETNAAMADEMVQRGKLIQHYCMEGRGSRSPAKSENPVSSAMSPGTVSVRRMVSLIRQIGGDGEGDVDVQHRKLQRMLEETLTKNMHLQEDIERLSQEVVRLSQLVGSSGHHLASNNEEIVA